MYAGRNMNKKLLTEADIRTKFITPALGNGVPVTINARWNVHVTLTTAVQMGLHAVSKVVRVTGCLGYEDHTQ